MLKAFAEVNPITIVVDAMRALWLGTPAGNNVWGADRLVVRPDRDLRADRRRQVPPRRGELAELPAVIGVDELRAIALELPGAFEQASYGGRPSWRTKQRMFAWVREDPEALVVWVESLEEKTAMIETDPRKFFTTPHYDDQPIVLVRLDEIDPVEAGELIEDSWRRRGAEGPRAELPRRASLTAAARGRCPGVCAS